MIFGLDQLEPAGHLDRQNFVERWQTAMVFQLGAEEFEKFSLGRGRAGEAPP